MARKPRIEFEGAFYHVITRGNQRQHVFAEEKDYVRYLEILSHYKDRYHFFLYGYVLMGNHVHLLMEMRETPLSKILQGITQRYTVYFNKKYRKVGHLFQGRYKALLCDKDSYLLSLIKYIHLNPVRAGVAKTAEEYFWSSHRFYIKRGKTPVVIDQEKVLSMFSEDKVKARKLYSSFMGDSVTLKKEDVYSTVDQRIVGDERFADEVMKRHDVEFSNMKRARYRSLEEIAKTVEELTGVSLKELRRKSKDRNETEARKLFAVAAGEYGYRGTEISLFLRKDPSVITRYLHSTGDIADKLATLMRSKLVGSRNGELP
jgi:REP element-mobilizing transposase RayT